MRFSALLLVALSCIPAAMAEPPQAKLSEIARGLKDPVAIGNIPGSSKTFYAAERRGRLRVFEDNSFKRDLLDLGDILDPEANGALASVAFPSDYPSTKHFFVSFTDKQGDTIVSRFGSNDGRTKNEDDLQVVIKVAQGFSTKHTSSLAFGPDQYLYIGVGDTRDGTDKGANAQNPKSLLGKILRLDVSDPANYKIPPTNPFLRQKSGAREILALGFQNPSSLAFNNESKRLLAIDTGEGIQELNIVDEGKNYGWNVLEGISCRKQPCAITDTTPPAFESKSAPLIGGFPYGGKAFPTLRGAVITGVRDSKVIEILTERGGAWAKETLLTTQDPIAALGETSEGEILVAFKNGRVSLVEPR